MEWADSSRLVDIQQRRADIEAIHRCSVEAGGEVFELLKNPLNSSNIFENPSVFLSSARSTSADSPTRTSSTGSTTTSTSTTSMISTTSSARATGTTCTSTTGTTSTSSTTRYH